MKEVGEKMKSTEQSNKTLQEQAYDYIYSKIINGEILPGSRLVEKKIVEETNISRSPIRESIRKLESEGLVTVNSRGGVKVYRPTNEDFKHLYECRISLEPAGSYYAALRVNDMKREKLFELVAKMKQEIEVNNINKLRRYSREFHDTILAFSENPFLIKLMKQLRSFTVFYVNNIIKSSNYERLIAGSKEHEEICKAISDGNGVMAKRLMEEHLTMDYEFFLSEYKDG